MKLYVISDLHIEFGTNWYPKIEDLDEADVVVLAGDIHNGVKAFEWINRKFPNKQVVYVAGNHEYYNHQHPGLRVHLNLESHKYPNIYYLDDSTVEIGGILFAGSTLWTDYNLFNSREYSMFMCGGGSRGETGLADHEVISIGHNRFMPQDALDLHIEAMEFLQSTMFKVQSTALEEKQKTVIVTHHCPTPLSVPDRYKMSEISPGFSSDLSKFILQYEPTLWIHGHTHTSFDYYMGATRVVCKPHGYPRESGKCAQGLIVEV